MQIGYYHLCAVDPSVLHHTDFDGLDNVFKGAWNRIEHAINIAHSFGIGILFGAYHLSISHGHIPDGKGDAYWFRWVLGFALYFPLPSYNTYNDLAS
jgi:hypothetical protein